MAIGKIKVGTGNIARLDAHTQQTEKHEQKEGSR